MTRLGWWMLLLFIVVIGGFALILRQGKNAPAPIATKAGNAPSSQPAALPRQMPAPTTAVVATGGLILPVQGVRPDQLTDTWGQARANGRQHHAIDIMATRGTPVLAAAAGTIEKLFESRDGGHTVYIRRTDPAWVDYYAHLDSYAPDLREGVAVRAGQPIGAVGSTGDASPEAPHLHYEIKQMAAGEKWWQGTDINPYPILAGKPGAR